MNIRTATIQIGNSDDKLSQKRWSEFITRTSTVIHIHCEEIHFSAGSPSYAVWQNYCFVFTIDDDSLHYFRKEISELRVEFGQDSIALTIGETEFV